MRVLSITVTDHMSSAAGRFGEVRVLHEYVTLQDSITAQRSRRATRCSNRDS